MLTCPVCRSQSIRRSVRRNIMERLWSLGGRYPFRCYDCQTRFFAYRLPSEDRSKEEAVSNGASPGERREKTIQVDEEDD